MGQGEGTAGKGFALHTDKWGLISGSLYSPGALPLVIPEHEPVVGLQPILEAVYERESAPRPSLRQCLPRHVMLSQGWEYKKSLGWVLHTQFERLPFPKESRLPRVPSSSTGKDTIGQASFWDSLVVIEAGILKRILEFSKGF